MSTPILTLAAIVTVGLLYVVLPVVVGTYRRLRGMRLVTCPETHETVAVEIDARRAALAAAVGSTALRLDACSRWPERQDCGQECVEQIEAAPEDCLVRTVVTKWFRGRTCTLCGEPFDTIESAGRQAAFLAPDGSTVEWGAVRSEKLPDLFASYQPVCWNCHVAESFRRAHPELVIERRPHG